MVVTRKNRVSYREIFASSSNDNDSVGGKLGIHFFNQFYTNILLSKAETMVSIQIHPH